MQQCFHKRSRESKFDSKETSFSVLQTSHLSNYEPKLKCIVLGFYVFDKQKIILSQIEILKVWPVPIQLQLDDLWSMFLSALHI